MKGAAFATFGDIVLGLMLKVAPLLAGTEGVKAGDSTFSRFLRLMRLIVINNGFSYPSPGKGTGDNEPVCLRLGYRAL